MNKKLPLVVFTAIIMTSATTAVYAENESAVKATGKVNSDIVVDDKVRDIHAESSSETVHELYRAGSFYVGGALGRTTSGVGVENNFFNPEECVAGVACSADDSDMSKYIFVGHSLNKNLAIELGYADLGKTADLNAQIGGFSVDTEQETKALYAAVIGKYPLGKSKFSVYGKAGVARWKSDISFKHTPSSAAFADRTESDSGISPVIGLGITYQATKAVELHAGYEQIRGIGERSAAVDINNNEVKTINLDNVRIITAGARMRF